MATIQGVYLALFGRPADPLGLSFFNQATNNGANLTAIGNLASTAEYQDRFTGQNNAQIITSIYQSLFNREPDLAGLTFFANALTNGTLNINNIAIAIYDGAQGADKTIRDLKEAAANAFTAAIDTPAEVSGYSGAAAASARAFIATVTTTAPTADQITAAVAAAVAVGGPAPTTFTLTNNPDSFTGKDGSDLFVASEATLSSADVLDGGLGIDTLRYASSGAATVEEGGFSIKDIERISVTSDVTGGNFTRFDLTGATGVTTLINNNSSSTASFLGVTNTVAAEVTNISGGNTFFVYRDSVVSGTADVQSLRVSGNTTNAGNAVGDISIGNQTSAGTLGIETLNISSVTAASKFNDIITGAKTITVTGDAALSVTDTLDGATLIDASGFKGALAVKADSGLLDVVVKGGSGNDSANFSLGFGAGDSFDGGDGTDTLGLTNAIATGGLGGTTTSVEALNITTAGAGTLDASKFAGVTRFTYDEGLGAATTVIKGTTGQTVEVDVNPGANQNLTYTLATNGTADVVTIELDDIKAAGSQVGTISVREAETLNVSFDDDATDLKSTVTLNNLTFGDAKSIVLSGDAETTIKGFTHDPIVAGTASALTTFNASGMTDHLTLTGLGAVLSKAGSTITLGSGKDTITNGTGVGADSITLGSGKDTIAYTALAQSSAAAVDTVQDFKQGEDVIDLFGLGIGSSKQFIGNFGTFGSAQGATKAFDGVVEAVFQSDTNTLWVDLNDDGTLNANDLQVVLKGVTTLTTADLGFVPGNNITLTAPAANVDLASKVNSTDFTTKGDDTINSTVANLAAVAVNGNLGTDTLNITDGGVVAGLNNFASIETLVLNAGTTIDATTTAGNTITKVVGSSAVDVVSINNAQTNVALGDGNDTLNVISTLALGTTLDGGVGTDTFATANNSVINNATIKGFEFLNASGTLTLSAAQHNGFLVVNGLTAADTFFLSDSGTLTGSATVETYNLSSGDDKFTLGNATQTVNANAGADTIIFAGGGNFTGTVNGGGQPALTRDVFQFGATSNITGATVTGIETYELTAGAIGLTVNSNQLTNQNVIGAPLGGLTINENGTDATINDLSGISAIISNMNDDRVLFMDDDFVGPGDTSPVLINLGVSDLKASGGNGGETGAYTINAAGGVATQVIDLSLSNRTVGDTVNATGVADYAIKTGIGNDTVTMGNNLRVADVVDGGAGVDTLNFRDQSAFLTELDGVTGFEIINMDHAGLIAAQIAPANSVVAAGTTTTFNAVGNFAGAGTSLLNFSAETDGQINFNNTAGANTNFLIVATSNNLVDTYTFGAGNETLTINAAQNTVANLANVDVITNFQASGNDNILTGFNGAGTWTVTVNSTNLGAFVGAVNSALASVANYNATAAINDAIIVNVTGSGALDGQYFIQDRTAAVGIDATAFAVKLVGAGLITSADFIA